MTIYEIKRFTQETAPFFFTSKTLKFFGQTMRSFSVKKQSDGRYMITAPCKDRFTGRDMGETKRFFNPITKELDRQ